jgi:hypothetical protein
MESKPGLKISVYAISIPFLPEVKKVRSQYLLGGIEIASVIDAVYGLSI